MPTEGELPTLACLCAAWCQLCTGYRETLARIAEQHPALRFAWIDIEDDADALGDDALEIDNFPTLMLLDGAQVRFHGVLLPHEQTLRRLLQAFAEGTLAPGDAARVPAAMAQAVARLAPQRPV